MNYIFLDYQFLPAVFSPESVELRHTIDTQVWGFVWFFPFSQLMGRQCDGRLSAFPITWCDPPVRGRPRGRVLRWSSVARAAR